MTTRIAGEAESSLSVGYRISTEWTIVDAQTAEPASIADAVLDDAPDENLLWTHGMALHTVHAKLTSETRAVRGLKTSLKGAVKRMNARLAAEGATLMGSGAHPFLEPHRAELWTGDGGPLYAACHRVFGCHRHGWVNSRTLHIGIPFDGDEEFARLHDAIRLVVPIIAALSAASPFLGGRRATYLDARLIESRDRHRLIRQVGGRLVPEAVRTQEAYRERVLEPLRTALEPHDSERVLDPEWLNSRAAIPRFARGLLTIREIDAQESPSANLAVAAGILAVVEALADRRLDNRLPEAGSVARLAGILDDVARDADQAVIEDPAYLRVFGVRRSSIRAGELWAHLLGRFSVPRAHEAPLRAVLAQGPLARRMVAHVQSEATRRGIRREQLVDQCLELAVCAAEDSVYD